MAAITISDVKTYLGISASTYDTQLTALVAQTQAAAENYCECKFDQADYVRYLNGTKSEQLYLPHVPVNGLVYVSRIAIGKQTALNVSYSGSDSQAQVRVNRTSNTNETAISVTLTSSTAGATTILTADQATLSAMATAISAVSGWSATVAHTDTSYPSIDLVPVGGIDAKSAQACLQVPYDLGWFGNDYTEQGESLYKSCGWGKGNQHIRVDYRAGYTSSGGIDYPTELKLALIQLTASAFRLATRDTSVQSETIGDYSYTNSTSSSTSSSSMSSEPAIAQLLSRFRREVF